MKDYNKDHFEMFKINLIIFERFILSCPCTIISSACGATAEGYGVLNWLKLRCVESGPTGKFFNLNMAIT